jgi:predicted dehydrogenase
VSVRILQIGVGIRGRHWAEIVRDHPDVSCVGLVDLDPVALQKARAIGGDSIPCYQDLDRALAEVEADASLIATPSALHAEHAILALRAGHTVMVEKPFALTVEDALRVLACARETGRQVMVAENYRYWPSERTVRKLIADGAVGRVDWATLVDRRHMPSATEGPWLAASEYPQLQEIAIHHFDSLRYFFDSNPTTVTARAWNAPWSDYRHGSSTEALVDLQGVRIQYVGTMLSDRFSFSLWIEGERGVIWTNRKYVFFRGAGSRLFRPVRVVKTPPGDEAKYPKGGTTSLLNALRDACVHGTIAETTGLDNIWTVAMVEAGKRSDRERRAVRIDEVYTPGSGPGGSESSSGSIP